MKMASFSFLSTLIHYRIVHWSGLCQAHIVIVILQSEREAEGLSQSLRADVAQTELELESLDS